MGGSAKGLFPNDGDDDGDDGPKGLAVPRGVPPPPSGSDGDRGREDPNGDAGLAGLEEALLKDGAGCGGEGDDDCLGEGGGEEEEDGRADMPVSEAAVVASAGSRKKFSNSSSLISLRSRSTSRLT